MISTKDTFEPDTFSAMTFAVGTFRGAGGIAGFRVCGTLTVQPLVSGEMSISGKVDGEYSMTPLVGGELSVDCDCGDCE